MSSLRLRILLGVAAVLAVALLWHWISGWGLVTLHEDDAPLSKVLRSIERQGGIRIVTNADPTTPVTIHVDRVPPAAAVDTVAAWMDGNWNVAYVAGATKADLPGGVERLLEGRRADGGDGTDYARFGGSFGGGFLEMTDTAVDVRRVGVKVTPMDPADLQSYADQIAQKSGLVAVMPAAWNPAVPKPPSDGKATEVFRRLVESAGGQWDEVFVVRVSEEEPALADATGPRPSGGFDGSAGGMNRGGPPAGPEGNRSRRQVKPEWVEERVLASIEQLPPAERNQAREDFDQMRAFWQQMRTLPESERRAAAEKFFGNPVFQERMAERMLRRESRRSPEKRAQRYRRYVERKQQAQSQNP